MPSASQSLNPNVHVGKGEDGRLTLVAFSGAGAGLMFKPFDFMDVTGTLRHSRILLRDPNLAWFHLGLGSECGDFAGVVQMVGEHLQVLGSEKIMTLGTSMGGYAALLAGHLLGADFAHAFSPQTCLDAASVADLADQDVGTRSSLARVHARLGGDAEHLDLRRVLQQPNGKTRFFVHVCAGHSLDLRRAIHLEGLPQVTVLRYPCAVHNVLIGMAHKRFLRTALTLEEQPGLVERHAALFGAESVRPDARPRMDTDLGKPLERIGDIVRVIGRERLTLEEVMGCNDLPARLGLDSMDLLEVIVGLENEFGVEIDPESVVGDDFRTIASMLAIVWAAQSAAT